MPPGKFDDQPICSSAAQPPDWRRLMAAAQTATGLVDCPERAEPIEASVKDSAVAGVSHVGKPNAVPRAVSLPYPTP